MSSERNEVCEAVGFADLQIPKLAREEKRSDLCFQWCRLIKDAALQSQLADASNTC